MRFENCRCGKNAFHGGSFAYRQKREKDRHNYLSVADEMIYYIIGKCKFRFSNQYSLTKWCVWLMISLGSVRYGNMGDINKTVYMPLLYNVFSVVKRSQY